MAAILFRLVLTYWGWDKMEAISQTIFSSAFSWMKMSEFQLKFNWSLNKLSTELMEEYQTQTKCLTHWLLGDLVLILTVQISDIY